MRLPGEEGKVLGICSNDTKFYMTLINNCTPKIVITDETEKEICTFDFDLDCYTEEMLRKFIIAVEDMKLYAKHKIIDKVVKQQPDNDGYIMIGEFK